MAKVEVGQEVIGKFRSSRGKGLNPMLMFPHGKVTEITENGFKVDFQGIKGEWTYKEEEIGKTVYLKEQDTKKVEEQLDYEMERERLGVEE